MGLAERRAVKAFQEETYPALAKQIETAAGKEIDMEVKWDTLAEEDRSHLYQECWPDVYFNPLIKALESICGDDMGKEAVAEGLEKVVIQNELNTASPSKWASFENKVLTLDHKPATNINQIEDRASVVQKLLEDNL